MTDISETLDFLNSLPYRDVKPGLERINYMLKELGNPEGGFPSIHVAGSNGKGSTSTLLSSILAQTKKVGEFTSPPMFGFGDRIHINGIKIEDKELIRIVEEFKPAIAKLSEKGDKLTLFETATAIAAK